MRPVLSREQMRAFDSAAIERGVPGIVLMENAGRGAAHLIGLKVRPRHEDGGRAGRAVFGSCVRCADEQSLAGGRVLIVAGPGNNGGDGFVVGRQLLGRAAVVQVALCAQRNSLRGDAETAARSFEAVGGTVICVTSRDEVDALLRDADVVVDALLGTGVEREVSGFFAEVISAINRADKFVVALDLPSGLDAETGRIHGCAVKAAHTVAFAHLKTGLLTTTGAEHSGRITLSHIGIPATLPEHIRPDVYLLEEADVAERLVRRPVAAHKKNVGHLGVVGGSAGLVGAIRLSGLAGLRAGAGLSTLISLPEVIDKLEAEVLELMTARHPTPDPGAASARSAVLESLDALVVGPGLGRAESALGRARDALAVRKPTVLDADGLRAFEGRLSELAQHPALVLTPHVGEAAGLLGISAEQVEANRFLAVRRLVEETGATVVLKGPRTLVAAPQRPTFVSAFGSPALATGGTGDVLSGIIGGLLATAVRREGWDSNIADLAWVGVALHGLAAEAWSEQAGDAGLVATDLLGLVPRVTHRLTAGEAQGR